MTAQHTPGPWREFRDADGHDIIAPDGTHIARVEPVNSCDPLAEQDANADLLAAASDLLAALKRFDKAMEQVRMPEWQGIWTDAINAIRKATTGGVKKMPEFYECGICGSMHSVTWRGDCREDAARFDVEALDTCYGSNGWREVEAPDLVVPQCAHGIDEDDACDRCDAAMHGQEG